MTIGHETRVANMTIPHGGWCEASSLFVLGRRLSLFGWHLVGGRRWTARHPEYSVSRGTSWKLCILGLMSGRPMGVCLMLYSSNGSRRRCSVP